SAATTGDDSPASGVCSTGAASPSADGGALAARSRRSLSNAATKRVLSQPCVFTQVVAAARRSSSAAVALAAVLPLSPAVRKRCVSASMRVYSASTAESDLFAAGCEGWPAQPARMEQKNNETAVRMRTPQQPAHVTQRD